MSMVTQGKGAQGSLQTPNVAKKYEALGAFNDFKTQCKSFFGHFLGFTDVMLQNAAKSSAMVPRMIGTMLFLGQKSKKPRFFSPRPL